MEGIKGIEQGVQFGSISTNSGNIKWRQPGTGIDMEQWE